MKEKIKELEKQIAELKEELEKKTEFRVNEGDDYYYIKANGVIGRYKEDNYSVDDSLYEFGNYFKSKEEAKKIAKKIKATAKVSRAINKANDGWEPNWDNPYQDRVQIALNPVEMEITWLYNKACKQALLIPYIKDFEIAEKIIEDYEEELKIIFEIGV